jgi:SAM-dependent methyltransferase
MTGTSNNWFASWFDSPYYHVLYKHRDHEEAELFLNNILKRLKPDKNSLMLDMPCGKGRHSIFLNEKGFNVVGADLSQESISHAKHFENKELKFAVHDIREEFPIADFDYLFNLFTSFGYFDSYKENQLALTQMANTLKVGGVFIMDFLNADYVVANLKKEQITTIDGIDFHITREFSDGFILKNIQFEDKGKQFKFCEKVRALGLTQLTEMFENANVSVEEVWGNYNLDKFEREKSERLIISGRKK